MEYNSNLVWITVGVVFIFLVVKWWKKNRNLPPGPLGWPFFGYYPYLKEDVWEQLSEISKKYGDVISFRTLGGPLVVVINDVKTAKEISLTRAEEFMGRPLQSNLLTWVDDGLGISQSDGRPWKEQRRFFSQAAKDFGFGKAEMEPLIMELVQETIEDIKLLDGEPFDLSAHICHITRNGIAQIIIGKQFTKKDPMGLKLIKGFREMFSLFAGPKLFCFGTVLNFILKFYPSGRLSERSRKQMLSCAEAFVEEHIRQFDPQNVRDFTDAYLKHMHNLEEKGQLHESTFSRERLVAIVMNMLMEGTESAGETICCLLSKMSQYPDLQEKAQRELDTVIGDGSPSWLDRKKLPYVEALIQELYRTNPFFIGSPFYSNYQETQINGHRIPKRSIIVMNFFSMNHNPEVFRDPVKFNPERFLDEDGKRFKCEGPYPFGIGKRYCIGEPLASMEVFLIIANLLKNFTFYSSDNSKVRAVPRKQSMLENGKN